MPDVLNILMKQDEEVLKKEIIELTQKTVEKLVEMRKFEGKKIAEDLENRMEEVAKNIKEISKIELVKEHKDKTKKYLIESEKESMGRF